jgi:hypothetical protein
MKINIELCEDNVEKQKLWSFFFPFHSAGMDGGFGGGVSNVYHNDLWPVFGLKSWCITSFRRGNKASQSFAIGMCEDFSLRMTGKLFQYPSNGDRMGKTDCHFYWLRSEKNNTFSYTE